MSCRSFGAETAVTELRRRTSSGRIRPVVFEVLLGTVGVACERFGVVEEVVLDPFYLQAVQQPEGGDQGDPVVLGRPGWPGRHAAALGGDGGGRAG
jgi:hypothetical protein